MAATAAKQSGSIFPDATAEPLAGAGSKTAVRENARTIDLSGFDPPPEAAATAAKLYAGLQDSEQFLVIAGWDKSDRPGEAALWLALGLASVAGEPILLVDAAPDSPGLHTRLGADAAPGLRELVALECSAEEAIRPTSIANLSFMAAGEAPAPPRSSVLGLSSASVFSIPEWTCAMARLREFRRVLINAGALPGNPRASVITSRSDAAVLAIAAGVRRRHEVADLQKQLGSLAVRIAGVVLTT
jgi:Mrp family chromosome partitioning ATPase